MDTQTQIERLIELAIVQRTELKQLVEQLPQLREHLNAEIERNLEEIEPQLRSELEEFCIKRAQDEHAKLGQELAAKVESMLGAVIDKTQIRYAALIDERNKNVELAKQAEAKIAEATAALPGQVKGLVEVELARFPRAGEIDQLRKEFAEPRGLNPRGKWATGETYNRLDLVSFNGDSFVSSIDGNTEKPNRNSGSWTLSAARGGYGGGGGITSLIDLYNKPDAGQVLIGNGRDYQNANLTAGDGIAITNGVGSITISANGGVNYQGTWNASTNTPALTSSVGTKGYYYVVSVAGSTNLNGITDWEVGDWAVFNGSVWQKIDNTDKVSAVFGRTGAVVAVSTDYSSVGITNTAIGASNPSTGAFTTLTATSAVLSGSLTAFNGYFKSTGDRFDILPQAAGSGAILAAFNNGATGYTPLTVDASSFLFRLSGSSTSTVSFGSGGSITAAGNATVGGTLTIGGATTLAQNTWTSSSDGTNRLFYLASGTSYYKGAGSGVVHEFRRADDTAIFQLTNALNATLAGNLTVSGTGTSSVAGNFVASSPDSWRYNAAKSGSKFVQLTSDASFANDIFWDNSSALRFSNGTAQDGTGYTERARFTSSGNLLLGTTTDTGHKLQVAGAGYFAATGVDNSYVEINNLYGKSIRLHSGIVGTNNNGFCIRNVTDSAIWQYFDGSGNAGFTGNATFYGTVFIDKTIPLLELKENGTTTAQFYTASGGLVVSTNQEKTISFAIGSTGTVLSLSPSTKVSTFSGPIKLANAYVAGAPTATGYVTIQDSSGTTYKVLVST